MAKPKLLIASDHAGYELKERLKKNLTHVEWVDLGPSDSARVDYPDFADRLSAQIQKNGGQGVLICGSGQGMAIRANRYRGVRAALVWNEASTLLSRQHNDANVLCLGARLVDPALSEKLVELFLSTKFEGGRHQDRINKLGLQPREGC